MKPFSALTSSSTSDRKTSRHGYLLRSSTTTQSEPQSGNLINISNVQIGPQSSPAMSSSSSTSSTSRALIQSSSSDQSHFLDCGRFNWGLNLNTTTTRDNLAIPEMSKSRSSDITVPISSPHSSQSSIGSFTSRNNYSFNPQFPVYAPYTQANANTPPTRFPMSYLPNPNPRVLLECLPTRQLPPANLNIWAYRTPPRQAPLSPEPVRRTEETFSGYPKVKEAYERLKAANLPDNYGAHWHPDEELVLKYVYLVRMKPKRPLAPMRYKSDYEEVYPANLKVDPLRHRNWRSKIDKVRQMENDEGLGLFLTQIR